MMKHCGMFFRNIFLEIFFGTNMIYFDNIILLIFLKQCDFLKLTMQGFKSDKNGFLNEYLFFYWALAHPVFQKSLFNQFACMGFWRRLMGFAPRFLRVCCKIFYGIMSIVLVCSA